MLPFGKMGKILRHRYRDAALGALSRSLGVGDTTLYPARNASPEDGCLLNANRPWKTISD